MHRHHTPYDKPRGLAGKRREPIYYSNRYPNGLHGSPTDYPPVPDPKAWNRRQRVTMSEEG